jgi:NAD(P)-dependent dehydrogenase (short-subunit alcohol dehydrogenase family)
MKDRLEKSAGKKAVVTGAASGLGRALALNLARDGWTVGIADINMPEAERTLEMVEKAGGGGEVHQCDVRDIDRFAETADHFFNTWGGVSLLINNAGIAVAGFTCEIDIKDWRRIVDINLMGMVHGCHAFIPRMKAQGGGHIVNVASAAGFTSLPEMAPYNITKAGVIGLSETLRTELAPDHIGVTVVCPLFFETNLDKTASYTEDFQHEFHVSAAENARMTADDVARIALRAARRGRLYAVPQLSAKLFYVTKRLSPRLYSGTLTFLYKTGVARPLVMWMARHGMC